MPTINQLCRFKRIKKKKNYRQAALEKCPQKKGVVFKLTQWSPKKPNSANRTVFLVRLSNNKLIYTYLPGSARAHGLQEHSIVLVRGGRLQDVPGVKYKLIRNKYDLLPELNRKNGRSKYGVQKKNRERALLF